MFEIGTSHTRHTQGYRSEHCLRVYTSMLSANCGHQPAEFEAFFFPDSAMPCKHTLRGNTCKRRNCSYARCAHHTTSLSRMLEVLHSARRTLDVCVFSITVRFSIDG